MSFLSCNQKICKQDKNYSILFDRSICENSFVPGEQKTKEKENDNKEMYPEPLLQ
jgi:hypothetical protein